MLASLCFAMAIAKIKTRTASLWSIIIGIHNTVQLLLCWIIKFLPVGMFFLTAGHTLSVNRDCIEQAARFLGANIIATAIHAFLILPAIYCENHSFICGTI